MRPVVIDRVAWSVGRSVTVMRPAKTAELIEMLFGPWAREHVLDEGPPDSPQKEAILGEMGGT